MDTLNRISRSLSEINIETLTDIAIIIASLVLAGFGLRYLLRKFVERRVRLHMQDTAKERKKRQDTIVAILGTVVDVFLVILGILLILSELGVDFAALVASAGAAAVILGVAAQSLIKDYLRGLSILLYNQYRIGDIITVSQFSGVVENFALRFTRLRDLDGNVHIIPNGEITIITNRSLGYSAVNLDVRVSYDSDITKVEEIINQVGDKMAAQEEWKAIVIEPIHFLRVDSFGDSSVNIKALGRVLPGEQWTVAGEFRRRLKEAFDKQGITIPLPQRVVHTTKSPAPKN